MLYPTIKISINHDKYNQILNNRNIYIIINTHNDMKKKRTYNPIFLIKRPI